VTSIFNLEFECSCTVTFYLWCTSYDLVIKYKYSGYEKYVAIKVVHEHSRAPLHVYQPHV